MAHKTYPQILTNINPLIFHLIQFEKAFGSKTRLITTLFIRRWYFIIILNVYEIIC